MACTPGLYAAKMRLSDDAMVLSALNDSASYNPWIRPRSMSFVEGTYTTYGPMQPWIDDRPMTTLASFLDFGALAKSLLSRTIRRMMHTSIMGRIIAFVISGMRIRCPFYRKHVNNDSNRGENGAISGRCRGGKRVALSEANSYVFQFPTQDIFNAAGVCMSEYHWPGTRNSIGASSVPRADLLVNASSRRLPNLTRCRKRKEK